ncbi:efflux RND transporter permease subunit [Solimonas flava]|uniref:efflux RND transporter permease subunit n=1 Tax=Solimonas flava TaxID=415849 RepID=UPI000A03CF1C|nr:efflux RND transporter permease subunit [Solimonas flava]
MSGPGMSQNSVARHILRLVEPIIFGHRRALLIVLGVATLLLAWQASMLKPQAGWLKMVPQQHPYMQVFLKHYASFGGANTIVVALKARHGTIYEPQFMDRLRQVTDAVFFVPGVDRSRVKSIFTPNTIYVDVIEDGLAGATVVPGDYAPTPEMVQRIRANVGKANVIGRLVSEDETSALVLAELQDLDPVSRAPLDYVAVGRQLEKIREQFEDDRVSVEIIGFAKVVHDMTEASVEVAMFFVVALLCMALLLWIYIGSLSLAMIVLLTSLVACVWELGLLHLVGYGLDPFAMLVPFLIMAVSVSHGVQYVNAWANEISTRGATGYQASLATFRALAIPGVVALLTNVAGFSTIYLIDIDVIREMSINAAFGMAGVILVNKALLPAVLSYLRLPNVEKFRHAQAVRERIGDAVFRRMSVLTERGPAIAVICVCIGLAVYGALRYPQVQIGDTTEGVPELRPDSRFNRDARQIARDFWLSTDIFTVVAETFPDACIDYRAMAEIDRFAWYLRNTAGVRDVFTLFDMSKLAYAGLNEGRLNAQVIPRDKYSLAQSTALVPTTTGLLNKDCSALAIQAYTTDHKASTLAGIVEAVKRYEAGENQDRRVQFRLASGNNGVMAATNEEVRRNELPVVIYVYAVVLLFLWLSFRTVSGVLCVGLPLALVTLLGYALMVEMGIGLKVATLPVLAFACGIGVDYGIYSYSTVAAGMRRGLSLRDAYYEKMRSTGKATLFTGVGLASGVAMWIFSKLQFQRDMGILLVFGFTANMIGAIVVLPALAHFLAREEYRHRNKDLTVGAEEAFQPR